MGCLFVVEDRRSEVERGGNERVPSTSGAISMAELPETDILDSSVSEEGTDLRERFGQWFLLVEFAGD